LQCNKIIAGIRYFLKLGKISLFPNIRAYGVIVTGESKIYMHLAINMKFGAVIIILIVITAMSLQHRSLRETRLARLLK
jgi:hypothetical protein